MNLKDIYKYLISENKPLKDFINILDQYNEEDYSHYLTTFCKNVIKDTYIRIKIDELSNDKFEFILIYWSPYSKTKIHDHPTNGCLMKILEGSLSENLYDNSLNNIGYYKLEESKSSYIEGNTILHSIENNNDSYTISLHIYSPPNYKTNYF